MIRFYKRMASRLLPVNKLVRSRSVECIITEGTRVAPALQSSQFDVCDDAFRYVEEQMQTIKRHVAY
jgi:hypothetical protein